MSLTVTWPRSLRMHNKEPRGHLPWEIIADFAHSLSVYNPLSGLAAHFSPRYKKRECIDWLDFPFRSWGRFKSLDSFKHIPTQEWYQV